MTACLCPQCTALPLHSYTPAFRLECEARAVLAWPIEERRAYLAARGVVARRIDLEAEMRRQFNAGRTA